ncbi:hypothetical protein EJB05_17258 [Eragrostis curvula]|uniref:DUF6598 domain-containing protein n=1 Tax=Eragrostis curvula TaxID=38414 RepID=A0A5J9VIJ2_9POAL|nr:hypothetical protein EJB05_17258 [Eragrostis curvula]
MVCCGEVDQGCGEVELQHVEEMQVTKKPRVEDEEVVEEDAELLTVLRKFRKAWEEDYSEFFGPFDGITGPDIGPKQYTESGPPRFGIDYDAMEIFSIKVIEIKEGMEWPLRVFGLVAVRDSMDYKRNILFQCSKENYQTITEKDCSLDLIGPSRAIALIDPPRIEVDLRVIGSSPWEVKSLCAAVITYNNLIPGNVGLIQTRIESRKRSTIELKFSHLCVPLEATIEISHSGGSSDFHGVFFAHVKYMGDEKVVLLDAKDRNVVFGPDGKLSLSRCVVLVKEGAVLEVGVKAWEGKNDQNVVESRATFPTKFQSKSEGELNVPFCKMSVSVFWSVLC